MFSVIHSNLSVRFPNLTAFNFLYDTSLTPSILAKYLSDSNPAVRFRVAKFIANFATVNLSAMLNLFFIEIESLISNFFCDTGRCGAIELILLLSKLEHKIIGAISLIAPLALKSINDPLESVRTAAAYSFGKFVALFSLENSENFALIGLNEILSKKYAQNQDFSKVLNCPANLPIIQTSEIPHLKSDITLRYYQLEGITWMRYLSKFGLNGILADDMGLGKTLQVLCVLALEQENLKKERLLNSTTDITNLAFGTLILCPRTLVDHWFYEWKKFFPTKKPFIRLESIKNQKFLLSEEFIKTKWDENFTLVLSYDDMRSTKILK